jgi:DNA-directed RNA polymerase specialized sigma24 family protein
MIHEQTLDKIDEKTHEVFFTEMYQRTFPAVARFVATHGGTLDDAKDIFQDSLVIFYELMNTNALAVHTSEHAYLVGIAKHVWLRKHKKNKVAVSLDELEMTIQLPEDYFEPRDQNLLALIEQTGQRCLDLLRAFYYDKLSLEEISDTFGFSGVRSATVQKFKCIEKTRAIVKQKSINYEDLAD